MIGLGIGSKGKGRGVSLWRGRQSFEGLKGRELGWFLKEGGFGWFEGEKGYFEVVMMIFCWGIGIVR